MIRNILMQSWVPLRYGKQIEDSISILLNEYMDTLSEGAVKNKKEAHDEPVNDNCF